MPALKFDPDSKSFEMGKNGSTELVILLHAHNSNAYSLRYIKQLTSENNPTADIWVPDLPISLFSFERLEHVTQLLIEQIDKIWEYHTQAGFQYEKIIIVGHSVGALLARKIYVCACGENEDAPFEKDIVVKRAKVWVDKIDRIILLAGMNRGWALESLSLIDSLWLRIGVLVGNILLFFTRKPPVSFQVMKGAPFITQLRIQWLSMIRAYKKGRKNVGGALIIQLLGTIDDLVSPEDNVDLITGADFYYLEVPNSGHIDVIEVNRTGSEKEKERYKVIMDAFVLKKEELSKVKVTPADLLYQYIDESVTDVVFVVHGIRDKGFWTQKIARRVKILGEQEGRKFAMETSSYGYFPMLSFLLSKGRREKVEWLMDQYTENLALYPNADFSYVGHSNGTYLLAKALKDYSACHFKNVVFAGSVVRSDYHWNQLINEKRVISVLNYVATADWVVAIFPKFFQMIRLQDLGSGGHDGFLELDNYQVKYIDGGHGAAIQERMWNSIAKFIVSGTSPSSIDVESFPKNRARSIVLAGNLSPLIWVFTLLFIASGGYCIWFSNWWESDVIKTIALLLYVRFIWFVLTKI